jgi:hypothetical protein
MTDDRELKTQWGNGQRHALFVLVIGHQASVIPASRVENQETLNGPANGVDRSQGRA